MPGQPGGGGGPRAGARWAPLRGHTQGCLPAQLGRCCPPASLQDTGCGDGPGEWPLCRRRSGSRVLQSEGLAVTQFLDLWTLGVTPASGSSLLIGKEVLPSKSARLVPHPSASLCWAGRGPPGQVSTVWCGEPGRARHTAAELTSDPSSELPTPFLLDFAWLRGTCPLWSGDTGPSA